MTWERLSGKPGTYDSKQPPYAAEIRTANTFVGGWRVAQYEEYKDLVGPLSGLSAPRWIAVLMLEGKPAIALTSEGRQIRVVSDGRFPDPFVPTPTTLMLKRLSKRRWSNSAKQ